MSVLIAVGSPEMSNILRRHLEEAALDVIENDVFHRNYLNEIIELEKPSMLILHDVFLPSDYVEKEKREEELLELLNYWRITFEGLRVVFLCERDRKDPFLGDLAARNVFDIFHERQISATALKEQLSNPPRYANVAKFGVGGLKIEYEDVEVDEENEQLPQEDSSDMVVPNETAPTIEPEISVRKNKIDFSEKTAALTKQLSVRAKGFREIAGKVSFPKGAADALPKENKEKLGNPNDIVFDDFIDLMPPIEKVQQRTAIIGTVLISVAGVVPHLGATHTAISIASYLQKLGHSVALVEGNDSQDFDRIHALYEGEKRMLRQQTTFEIEGIEHYKYRDQQDLYEIFPLYEYVVLDLGCIQDTPYMEDFKRSHVKCVVCSSDEWKLHWIDEFKLIYPNHEDVAYIVPGASTSSRKDLEERLSWRSVYSFPIHESPYKPNREVESLLYNVLGEFIKSPKKTFTGNRLIVTSAISIVVTAGVMGVFYFIG